MIRNVIALGIFLSAFSGAFLIADDGFVQFMPPAQLQIFKSILPHVDNPALQTILDSPETMWYDHSAMIPLYQDSITPITGVRANQIGRELAVDGERVFNQKKQFHFPYSTTAGLDTSDNAKVMTFWAPPKQKGAVVPVVWWNDDTGRYRWIFPVGTTFGEAMFVSAGDGSYHPFEIRTRTRYLDGWTTRAYRPFPTAKKLADAIRQRRPNWQSSTALKGAVESLIDGNTLQPARLESQYFAKAFDPVEGALDAVPDLGDDLLVKDLLHGTVFESAEGKIWKEHGRLETYAASTKAAFHIVPRDYQGGLVPVNEISCTRCHEDTGRQIGEFSFNSLLYGEVWGEDRIFSWHLFEQNDSIYGPYDRNRKVNSALVNAKLVVPFQPSVHSPELYKMLPRRFKIYWY